MASPLGKSAAPIAHFERPPGSGIRAATGLPVLDDRRPSNNAKQSRNFIVKVNAGSAKQFFDVMRHATIVR